MNCSNQVFKFQVLTIALLFFFSAHNSFAGAQSTGQPTSQIRLLLSKEKRIDPQTGAPSYIILNPSGLVELTYFGGGVVLTYQNTSKQREYFKIHMNPNDVYSNLQVDSENPRTMEIFHSLLNNNASLLTGAYLSSLSQQPSILFMKAQPLFKFQQIDFDAKDFEVFNLDPRYGAFSQGNMLMNVTTMTLRQAESYTPQKQQIVLPETYSSLRPLGAPKCANIFN